MSSDDSNFSADDYIEKRLKQYQSWYDGKAVSCKARYLRLRLFTVIAGAIVPVLINVGTSIDAFLKFPTSRAVVTFLSLAVVVAVSLESVFHYREQWKNYRSTEQRLGHEHFLFTAGVGPYEGLAIDKASRLLVERVEDAIAAENAATLSVMTLASETTSERQK